MYQIQARYESSIRDKLDCWSLLKFGHSLLEHDILFIHLCEEGRNKNDLTETSSDQLIPSNQRSLSVLNKPSYGKNKTGNIYQIIRCTLWRCNESSNLGFFFENITFFHTQCSCFYTILKILHCENATGLSSGELCSVIITESQCIF